MPESKENIDTTDENLKIEFLEKKLSETKKEMRLVEEKLRDSQDRFQEVMESKKEAQKRLDELEIMKIDFELNKYHEFEIDYNKQKHRSQVTKNLLDEAREKISFQNKVIEDLDNRGLLDFILRRYPESFYEYKKAPSNFISKKNRL